MVSEEDQKETAIPVFEIEEDNEETEGNASQRVGSTTKEDNVPVLNLPDRPEIVTEDSHSEDEEDQIKQLSKVPEFQEVLVDTRFSRTSQSTVSSHGIPCIDKLEAEVMAALEQGPGTESIQYHVRGLISALKAAKENERRILNSLQSREAEYDRLAEQAKRDTRAVKMMKLADRWRKEHRTQGEVNEQLTRDVTKYQIDLQEMELSLEAMEKRFKTAVKRCKDERERQSREHTSDKTLQLELKLKRTELYVRTLERATIEKNAKIHELKKTIEQNVRQDMDNDMLEYRLKNCEREKAALMAVKIELQSRATTCKFSLAANRMNLKVVTKELGELKADFSKHQDNIRHLHDAILKQNRVIQEGSEAIDRYQIMTSEDKCEIDSLNYALKGKEMSLKRVIDDVKHRDALLFHTQTELDQLKAKFQLVSTKEKSAVQASETLGKNLNKLDKENTHHLRKIELLNGKSNKVNTALKEEQRKLKSALDDAHALGRTLDETVPKLKNYIAANNSLFEDSLQKAKRITELQQVSSSQMRVIKHSETNMRSLMHKINGMEIALEKTHESLGLCKRANCKLVSDAFDQLEHARALHKNMKTMASELKTGARQMDDQDAVIQSLLLREAKMNEEINSKMDDINILHAEAKKASEALQIKQHAVHNLKLTLGYLEESLQKAAVKEKELIQQRDVFAARVVQAKVELQLQEEKIITLEDVVTKGNVSFNQQVSDKVLLVTEVKNLRKTVSALDRTKADNERLKDEVVRARREFTAAQIKNKALEEMVPTRIHPMRAVKERNESEYAKVMKIQCLSKRLIQKTDTVLGQEQQIISLQRQLHEMTVLHAKSGKPGLAIQVMTTKADLAKKNKRIKSLNAELNMFSYESSRERSLARQTELQFQEKLDRANRTNAMLRSQPRPPQSARIQPNPRRAFNQRCTGRGCLHQAKTARTPKTTSAPDNKPSKTYGDISCSSSASEFVPLSAPGETPRAAKTFGLKNSEPIVGK